MRSASREASAAYRVRGYLAAEADLHERGRCSAPRHGHNVAILARVFPKHLSQRRDVPGEVVFLDE